ncbi:hypothetical protein GL263_24210 [Streptomyces durbertensis]|uniref:Uncharacterized protein n=1 Tax=Streptomyces durbertensis TaxID=2448886 RepID=A0ABR6EPY6_9ACTN|nr:hypothetical protein [Streptomyces durbertensis]
MAVMSYVDGYWCEAVVRSPEAEGEWLLGTHLARSPAEAMRWLRAQAERIARALDPLPGGGGPFPPTALHAGDKAGAHVGHVLREWLDDRTYQETQRRALEEGRHISANAGAPDRVAGARDEAQVYYSLSCRPITRRRAVGLLAGEAHYGTTGRTPVCPAGGVRDDEESLSGDAVSEGPVGGGAAESSLGQVLYCVIIAALLFLIVAGTTPR